MTHGYLTRWCGDIQHLLTRAAGVIDEHGNLHAPKGLGRLSGRFVSRTLRNLHTATPDDRDRQLRTLLEGTHAGFTTTVDLTGTHGPTAWAQGTIDTPDGRYAGRFGYTLSTSENGDLWADLDDIHLTPDARRKGFATTFTRTVLDRLRDAGARGVRVEAEEDGGYRWAAFETTDGRRFTFGDPHSAQHVLDKLREAIDFDREYGHQYTEADRTLAESLLDRAERTGWGHPDFPTPYEVSQLGRHPDARSWLGKDLMTDTEWSGTLHLTDAA